MLYSLNHHALFIISLLKRRPDWDGKLTMHLDTMQCERKQYNYTLNFPS